jgi:hypothetical protein
MENREFSCALRAAIGAARSKTSRFLCVQRMFFVKGYENDVLPLDALLQVW